MKENDFDQLAADLEAQLETPATPEESEAGLLKAITSAAKDFLSKSQTSDLKAEKDKRGSLVESSDDPAKSAKKSNSDTDSSKYEARKGSDMDDDEDEDDKDDKKGKKMPSFFKKKLKKMKKSEDVESEDEDEESDEMFDATEVVTELQKSVTDLQKSMQTLEEGVSVFGELLTEMADPRHAKNQGLVLKALTAIISRQDKIEKSLAGFEALTKAINTMPNAPKMAGLHSLLKKGASEGTEEGTGSKNGREFSKDEQGRLMKAVIQGKLSQREVLEASRNGDASIFEKIK